MIRIAIVNDDSAYAKIIADYLSQHDCNVNIFQDIESLFLALGSHEVLDIVLLGWPLHKDSGSKVLIQLRMASDIACIVLANLNDDMDRIVALEIGADDYVAKGASAREILARIRAVLRRAVVRTSSFPQTVKSGGWRLALDKRELYRPDGTPCRLTSSEFAILRRLSDAKGNPVSRDELCEVAFHARPYRNGDRVIDVAVAKLRQKIEPVPRRPEVIKTVRHVGYVFTGFPSSAPQSSGDNLPASPSEMDAVA